MKTKHILSVLTLMVSFALLISCGSDDNKSNPEDNQSAAANNGGYPGNSSKSGISLEGDWVGNPMRGSGTASDSCDMTCIFTGNTISLLRVSKTGTELERVAGTYTLADTIITATWTVGRYDTEEMRVSKFTGTEMRLIKRNIIYKMRLVNNHGNSHGGSSGGDSGGGDYDNGGSSNNDETRTKCKYCQGNRKCYNYFYIPGDKYYCHGSGDCAVCGGDGYHDGIGTYNDVPCGNCLTPGVISAFGNRGGDGNCKYCRGTGVCSHCGGSGYE